MKIDLPHDDMPGKDVPEAVRDGRMDEVIAHCARDVERCRMIYQRVQEM
jgi:hypothetical protein